MQQNFIVGAFSVVLLFKGGCSDLTLVQASTIPVRDVLALGLTLYERLVFASANPCRRVLRRSDRLGVVQRLLLPCRGRVLL